MKKHKICKILLVILAIFLCVAFYELLGICVAYKKQPEVSNTTKKETKNGSWNECSENTEGGYSYHGKSILIDDDLSVIGSFNMDMRSAYLDTELMLVIRSKDINKQLEEGMMEYERVSRQVLEDGTYRDPYHVEPIELTKKRQRKIFLVQHLLGWARYLF